VTTNLRCLIGDHQLMLQLAKDRLFLKCSECGKETPGWDLAPTLLRSFASTSSQASVARAWRPFNLGADSSRRLA
jgi:hypothetical protein